VGENLVRLFLAEVPGVEDKEEDSNEFSGEIDFDSEELEPQVSMNVMNGIFGFHTMRINGHMGKKTLHVQIYLLIQAAHIISWM